MTHDDHKHDDREEEGAVSDDALSEISDELDEEADELDVGEEEEESM